jgi:hypothetical protein
MKCYECRGKAEVVQESMDGVKYDLYRCTKCGEKFLDMKQLKVLGEKHRKMRESYTGIIARWGNSTATRIPSDLAKEYGLKAGTNIRFLKEKDGIKIIPV